MTKVREFGRNIDRSSHDRAKRAGHEHHHKQNELPHEFPLMEFEDELSTRSALQSVCSLKSCQPRSLVALCPFAARVQLRQHRVEWSDRRATYPVFTKFKQYGCNRFCMYFQVLETESASSPKPRDPVRRYHALS